MALPIIALELIKTALQKLVEADMPQKKILSLGYPDILASRGHIAHLFGEEIASQVRTHPDSAAIIRWHKIPDITHEIIESQHLFQLLGHTLEVIDIEKARGNEILLDLNAPIPPEFHAQYALIIDSGTCEHCFNIAQAVKNVAEMCAVGGFVLHGNPLNMFNHGFYNLNPTWYYDFYETNGFSMQFLQIVKNAVHAPELFDAPSYDRFGTIAENASILAIVQRQEARPITWPVQTKYKNNPTLRG